MKQLSKDSIHRAVMVREVMEFIKPKAGGHYLDATLGGGTHSEELLKLSAPDGQVLSLDVDIAAINRAQKKQSLYPGRWKIVESNFRHMREQAEKSGLAPFDGILMDLGLSSDELEDPSKGLSFQVKGPLDMRLGPKANDDGLIAATIVNHWSEHELTKMISLYGEERYAGRIARAIIARRQEKPLEDTLDLAQTIKACVPAVYARSRIHPATKTFQALRIAVNDELQSLLSALNDADSILADGGTIVVISFHSLEDRIVKQTFKKYKEYQITKKPVRPTEDEIKHNPRARSAKLRAAHKNATTQKYLCHGLTLLL